MYPPRLNRRGKGQRSLEPEPPDNGKPPQTDKVVRLVPRDWLGPPDQLVPLGSTSDAGDGVWGEDDGFGAAAFWSADSASLQSPVVSRLDGRLAALRNAGLWATCRRQLKPIAGIALAVALVVIAIIGSASAGSPAHVSGVARPSGARHGAARSSAGSVAILHARTHATAPHRAAPRAHESHRHRPRRAAPRHPAAGRPAHRSGGPFKATQATAPSVPAAAPSSQPVTPARSATPAVGPAGGGGCFPGDVGC